MSRIRVICTIGPKSQSPEMLVALKNAGMSVARLNGSHADLEWHRKAIAEIRKTVPGVPILLDIPGRKIRTIQLAFEPRFERGDCLILTTDTEHDGTEKVPVNYGNLHNELKHGDVILADDGTLRFVVDKVEGRDIYVNAEMAGCLRSRKGINVPFVKLDTPQVTPRDEEMIAFAKETEVDFIGLSFVESAEHVEAFRNMIDDTSPRIVAKVENQGGIEQVTEIAKSADAIMIDRGDLAVETNLLVVAILQKHIIEISRQYCRPVIVATEMLHTMINNPYPTKAEVSDITNAVLDGCAATMLSGETAIGEFPLETVQVMREVVDAADDYVQARFNEAKANRSCTPAEAFSEVIPQLARSLPITKIVAVTRYGEAARMIAAHCPQQVILAVSDDAAAARSFNFIPGTIGVHIEKPFPRTTADHIIEVLHLLWQFDQLKSEDLVLITGVLYPHAGARMNTVQTHKIADLSKLFNWTK